MTRTILIAIVIAASAGIAAPAPEPPATRKASFSDYDVLLRKSIFSRDRSRPWVRMERPTATSRVREASAPVFVGAVLEESGYVGFVEDPEVGRLVTVRVGEKLPGDAGVVAALSLDFLDITTTADAAPRRIALGQTLLGTAPATRPTEAVSTAGGTATTAPSTPGTGEDPIERMKRLRRESLGIK